MIDQKRVCARISVLGWISDQRKPADHLAANDVIHLTARSGRSLLCQDLEIVTVERYSPAANAVALPACLGDKLAKRACLFTGRRLPKEFRPFCLVG